MEHTLEDIFALIERLTSDHGSWSIKADDRRNFYETVEKRITAPMCAVEAAGLWDFESEADKAEAIATQRFVTFQWYRDTPGACFIFRAPNMARLMEWLAKFMTVDDEFDEGAW